MTAATLNPPQHQDRQPGLESEMNPLPVSEMPDAGGFRLCGQVAIVTGGDSGIGRAVSIAYAKEGADVVIVYLDEHGDANDTAGKIRELGRQCLLLAGDVGDPAFCREVVDRTLGQFGRLDILVNNAAEQHPQDSLADIDAAQLERTFRTNVFSMFYLTQAALPHLKSGARIINTTSVTAYRGNPTLLDYASSKGAIVAFTRSLSQQLVPKGIRVNAVAPGPVWTPLIPSTFDAEKVSHFGDQVPMNRPGQPAEIAPAYIFLASSDSSYMSGQVLHPNGGEVING
ncbi:SDR family oxidoreductase [Uliginosibacterium sp. H1]|uniref:SDR family oxidoreductase n=1 Tax=Uliginosibacterium sp. H1 TaxID=3114757 RepID=UPI002E182AC4|nr:SDR family oxidoreductase [Uliginosibacterium sp. H1]